MNELDTLESFFNNGFVTAADGAALMFEGAVAAYPAGLASLEASIGFRITSQIATFLLRFGGTKLFVNRHGLGTEIFAIATIVQRNLSMLQPDDPYWPLTVMTCPAHHQDDQVTRIICRCATNNT
jgi:hypothetical protein